LPHFRELDVKFLPPLLTLLLCAGSAVAGPVPGDKNFDHARVVAPVPAIGKPMVYVPLLLGCSMFAAIGVTGVLWARQDRRRWPADCVWERLGTWVLQVYCGGIASIAFLFAGLLIRDCF
jgi:hypothetical protein